MKLIGLTFGLGLLIAAASCAKPPPPEASKPAEKERVPPPQEPKAEESDSEKVPADSPRPEDPNPNVICDASCCWGMHVVTLNKLCPECRRTIFDEHKLCTSCAQKLKKCVHCGKSMSR
ncbi:MAG: hypothetical protein HY716_11260 [Planctomycetes bacterium]|nr:hypothetical protein [Planctomycetota bacterium]